RPALRPRDLGTRRALGLKSILFDRVAAIQILQSRPICSSKEKLMKTYLKYPSGSLARLSLLAAAFVVAPAALAQQPTEPPVPPPTAAAPEQAIEVSDQEIETFATIYVDLQETADKFEQEMA